MSRARSAMQEKKSAALRHCMDMLAFGSDAIFGNPEARCLGQSCFYKRSSKRQGEMGSTAAGKIPLTLRRHLEHHQGCHSLFCGKDEMRAGAFTVSC